MTKIVELPSLPPVIPLSDTPLRNSIMYPQIDGNVEIQDGTIFAKKLVVGVQTWSHNIVWTATDFNTASWGSGSVQMSDGTTYAVDAGNTGNIAATTYVYFDKTTTLKTTTTYSEAIGNDKILLAIVELGASGAKCVITALGAPGTTIDADRITTGRIQSADTKTYFDLDAGTIIVNDGSNDRCLFGFQSGGF